MCGSPWRTPAGQEGHLQAHKGGRGCGSRLNVETNQSELITPPLHHCGSLAGEAGVQVSGSPSLATSRVRQSFTELQLVRQGTCRIAGAGGERVGDG